MNNTVEKDFFWNFPRQSSYMWQVRSTNLWDIHVKFFQDLTHQNHQNPLIFDRHTHPFNGPLSGTTRVSRYQKGTRNSAIAEGPRDALSQLNSWQLPRNSAETTSHSSRFHCLIGVINKSTTVELRISPVYRRLAVAKFSKSTNIEIAHVTPTTPT